MARTSLITQSLSDHLRAGILSPTVKQIDIIVSYINAAGAALLTSRANSLSFRKVQTRIITTLQPRISGPDALLKLATLPNTQVRVYVGVKKIPEDQSEHPRITLQPPAARSLGSLTLPWF